MLTRYPLTATMPFYQSFVEHGRSEDLYETIQMKLLGRLDAMLFWSLDSVLGMLMVFVGGLLYCEECLGFGVGTKWIHKSCC